MVKNNKLSFLLDILILLSTIVCTPQLLSKHIDIADKTGINPPTDFVELFESNQEKLFKLTIPNSNTYNFSNLNKSNDGITYNWVNVNICLVYFVSDSNINFTIIFKHIFDENDSTKNVQQIWTQQHFSLMEQDYANNGKNSPIQKKRTFIGIFLVNIPAYEVGKLTINFQNNTPGTFYFKNFRVIFSTCKPDCLDCNNSQAYSCNSCINGYSNLSNQCNCNLNGSVAVPLFNPPNYFEYQCFSSKANIGTDYDLCNGFNILNSDLKLDYCNSCLAGSLWKYSINTQTGISCECPVNYFKINDGTSYICKSRIEQDCIGYPNNPTEDTSSIINTLNSLNLKIEVRGFKDAFTGQDYYNVDLNAGVIGEYLRLAYKLFISAPNYPIRIQNTYYKDSWIDSTSPGINLNLQNLGGIPDCSKTIISNGATIWKCIVSLIAFHPCKNFMYMNDKIPIEIGQGGVVKSSIDINTSSDSMLINIPCIHSNSCFINKDFSSTMFICEDQSCKNSRSKSFKIGDIVWLRSILTVANGENPASYQQNVETSSFDLYDINYVLQNSISMNEKYIHGVDFVNQPLLGFPIPMTAELLINDIIVTGKLTLSLVLRVDHIRLRILQKDSTIKSSYYVTAPMMVNINIDPNSIPGYNSNYEVNSKNIINQYMISIIVVASVLAILIISIVVYFYKKRNQTKLIKGQPLPISDPSSRVKAEVKYDTVGGPVLKTLNSANNNEHNENKHNENKHTEVDNRL